MSRTTRIAFVAVAALIAVGAVVIWASSRDDKAGDAGPKTAAADAPTTSTAQTTSEASGSTTTDTAPAKPEPVVLGPGKVQKIKVQKGDQVRFEARSPTDNEVHVHGYDILKDAPAGKTIEISFPADIEGIFEIEFEQTGEQIAELEVRP